MMKITSIKELIKQTFENKTNIVLKYEINTISQKIIKLIYKILKIDVSQYKHTIDNYSIKHTILKHGNEIIESKRGQIVVTLDKFEKVPKVLDNPDNITFIGKNKLGNELILYEKKIDHLFYYVEEVRTGKKEMAMVTMYIRKVRK